MRASARPRATSSSRSTATSRTTRRRSRGSSRSSTRATTSSPAGRRNGTTRPSGACSPAIFNTVTGWLSGLRLHDMNCGLKAFRAEVARELDLYGELHRFIPVLAHDLGFRVTEIAVNHRPREHGRSRYGMERYVRGFLDLLTVTFMGRYRHRPLHLFGGLGLVLSSDRQRDPRLPHDRQAERRGDRAAAAAPARRPARRRRDPVPLARACSRSSSRASIASGCARWTIAASRLVDEILR